jgi:hypothetical protein
MALFKKIFFAIFILLISAVIFFLLVQDREVKQDILRTTLNLFGDELLAMVPDGEQKKMLEKRYQDFLSRAERDQVADEEIERVAAAILNLSNRDTTISAEAAINVLGMDEKMTAAGQPRTVPPIFRDRGEPELPSSQKRKLRMSDRYTQKQKLAERLRKLQEFNETFNQLSEKDTAIRAVLPHYINTPDSGIVIALPEIYSSQNIDPRHIELREHLKELEAETVIKFHADMEEIKKAKLHARKALFTGTPLHESIGLTEAAVTAMARIDSSLIDSIGAIISDSLQKKIELEVE